MLFIPGPPEQDGTAQESFQILMNVFLGQTLLSSLGLKQASPSRAACFLTFKVQFLSVIAEALMRFDNDVSLCQHSKRNIGFI